MRTLTVFGLCLAALPSALAQHTTLARHALEIKRNIQQLARDKPSSISIRISENAVAMGRAPVDPIDARHTLMQASGVSVPALRDPMTSTCSMLYRDFQPEVRIAGEIIWAGDTEFEIHTRDSNTVRLSYVDVAEVVVLTPVSGAPPTATERTIQRIFLLPINLIRIFLFGDLCSPW